MPSGSRCNKPLQVQTIVEQPLTALSVGRISCTAIGLEPITFNWRAPHGKEIQLDSTGSEAYGLAPGRYAVHVESNDGSKADVSVDIAPSLKRVIAVNEYVCKPTSSGVSFDGSVQAQGHGLESWTRFLWSNGAETTEPVLRDARPGWYSLTPLPVGEDVPVFVQYCAPGQVVPSRITRL